MSKVVLVLGTKKGLFTLESDAARENWTQNGPFMMGNEITHGVLDARDGSLYATDNNPWFGPRVGRSTRHGRELDVRRERAEIPRGLRQERRQRLAHRPGSGVPARPRLLRRRPGIDVPQRRRRRELARKEGTQRAPDARQVVPRQRRPDRALDRARPEGRQPHVGGD